MKVEHEIRSTNSRWRLVLDTASSVALIGAALAVMWSVFRPNGQVQAGRTIPVPTIPIALDGASVLGSANAPVVMIAFSDFQCPYCGQFVRSTFPALKASYVDTGKVQVAFRHHPLPMHDRAERAAEGAECAAAQGKFWPMHDMLFEDPKKLAEIDLIHDAGAVGLDSLLFTKCMSGGAETRVKADTKMAEQLGLSGTPAFLVGRREADGRVKVASVILGAKPIGDFKKALDGLLKS